MFSTPTSLQQAGRSLNSIKLKWKVNGASSTSKCNVYKEDHLMLSVTPGWFQGDWWQAVVEGLEADQCYKLSVTVTTASGEGPASCIHAGTCTLPGRPQNLKQEDESDTFLKLTWVVWDPVSAPVQSCVVRSDTEVLCEIHRPWKHDQHQEWVCSLAKREIPQHLTVAAVNAVGQGSAESIITTTLSRPPAPRELIQVQRALTSLCIQWKIEDPPGAQVESCQICVGHEVVAEVTRDVSRSWASGSWFATISGLMPSTAYKLMVRGTNSVGHGPASFIHALTVQHPPKPYELQQTHRYLHGVGLQWKVPDPQESSVLSCIIRSGSTELVRVTRPFFHRANDFWYADVLGLPSNNLSELTVSAANDVGEGPGHSISVETCKLPPCPRGLRQVEISSTEVLLTWSVEDPVEAAVERCNVWVGNLLTVEVQRPWQHKSYQCWEVSLCKPSKQETVSVGAVNPVGEGPTSQIPLYMLKCPSAPYDLCQADRSLTSVTLSWSVLDPPGSQVAKCIIKQNLEDLAVVYRSDAYDWVSGKWGATALCLQPCCEYQLGIVAVNSVGAGPVSRLQASTIFCPSMPTEVHELDRSMTSVQLAWKLKDPENSEVCRCIVRSSDMAILADVTRADAYSWMSGFWRTTVSCLQPSRKYTLKVSGSNFAGEGSSFDVQVSTLSKPPAPHAVAQSGRSLTSLTLQWRVDDPVEAHVKRCLLRSGLDIVAEITRPWFHRPDKFWSATLKNLKCNQTFDIEVVAMNDVGESPAAGICAGTLSCPEAIHELKQAEVLDKSHVFVSWMAVHPPGAPIDACVVYLGGVDVAEVSAPKLHASMEPFAMQTIIVRPAEVLPLSVVAKNMVGDGPISTIPAWTCYRPQAPHNVQQIGRSPTTVGLHWKIDDPVEHRVEKCLLRSSNNVLKEVLRPPGLKPGDFWEVTIEHLKPAQTLSFHLSAVSSIEEGPQALCTVQTSVKPEAPHVWQTERSATSVNPVGAPVDEVLVWIKGRDPVRLLRSEGRIAMFQGLRPNTTYSVCARASNAVGGGVVGKVHASTSHSPMAPLLTQSDRSPSSITLQWEVSDPCGASVAKCMVQLGTDIFQSVPRPVGCKPWQVTFGELEPSQILVAKVTAVNAAGSSPKGVLQVGTSTPPLQPQVTQIARGPSSVSLQWRVADPLGAPVTKCTVWIADEIACVVHQSDARGMWTAKIKDLEHSQTIWFNVVASNAVGEGHCGCVQACTSEPPEKPCVKQTQTLPQGASLECTITDPEGAPVESCIFWLGWTSVQAYRVAQSNRWRAMFRSLKSEKAYWVCAIAKNAIGEGPQIWLQIHTSTRPAAPEVHEVSGGATDATLQWTVVDPPGAPVEKCLIKMRGQVVGEAHRQDCCESARSSVWWFHMTGLQPSRRSFVKVSAVNEVGVGPACSAEVFTTCPPKTPWIDQTHGGPNSVTFKWTVEEPIGAPVEYCEVVLGDRGVIKVWPDQGWQAHMDHLKPGQKVAVSVAAINEAGRSRTKHFTVYTSRFDRNDGKVYEMYHGTSAEAARSIRKNGFRPSTGGMLGAGVYLSRDRRKAEAYGQVILRCRVNVGRVKCINHQGHKLQQSWHHHGYDTAWVPPNCGMVGSGLEEDCVFDPRRIKIIG